MKTTRRQFIKISSAGAFGLAATGSFLGYFAKAENTPEDDTKVKRYPTYCEVCFWKCAGWTYTNEEGKIWKVIGNEKDPLCNGRLCPRGTGGVGMYFDEDRITKPLMRSEENGKQVFKEVSWDKALDFIASKMKKIAKEHGPESMALFSHGSGGSYLKRTLNAYGSKAYAAPSYAQCRGPREAGFIGTFGKAINSPEPTDIKNTRCLVLIGSHLGENMHNAQVQEMSEAIDRGASIITVDPRFSTAASKSKFWLPIKPSTDIALLLAWMNVIIENEWYDKEYVEKYTYGIEQLKSYVKDFTPEWAYGITTIKPNKIIETAREMANASPAVIIHPGRHVTWYGDDTQRARAVAMLNALLGSWGRRGGFYSPTRASLPSPEYPEFPKPKWGWQDVLYGRYGLAGLSVTNAIVEASIPQEGKEHAYKGWIVNGTNLIETLPDRETTLKAIENLDLMVVIDTMPMEITGYADVILPECTYLERYDSPRTSQFREPTIALRMPAAKPKGNSKPGWWMAKNLADKLGLSDYFPFKTHEEEIDWQLKQAGTSLDEMKKNGVKRMKRQYDDLYFANGEDIEFNTPTGKIELYSVSFEQAGFDPLPKYTAHPQPPAGFYRLIYGRAPMHSFSRTANNPNLTDLMDENSVWINPKVAKQWGLETNQYIWLKNQDDIVSDFPIKIRVTERIRWDSVYMVHGFGHSNRKLSRSHGKGASDSQLITNVMTDPVMGGTGMRGNFVTFLTENPGKEDKA